MDIEERTIQAGGVKVHARITGDGEQMLVLLHGAEADGGMWEPYMEGLAIGRRVMAIDLPGHGGSHVTADMDCSPVGIADWFSEVLAAEGVETAAVLGHSFGGVVAFNLALDVPELVSHLIGVNVANLSLSTTGFREGAEELMKALAKGDLDDETTRTILSSIYDKDPDHEDIVAGAAFWGDPGVRTFFANGGHEFSHSLPVWRLREVVTPTLLVWGDRDRYFPVEDARTASLYIPHSRLVVIEGGAHSPFSDAPGIFYMTVDSFLGKDD